MTNWTNKWVVMLLAGIIIQSVVYSSVWLLDMFAHSYMSEVLLIAMSSIAIQAIGFLVIMSKTRDEDPEIYGQGRPFQHKLREEDEEMATRKPTF